MAPDAARTVSAPRHRPQEPPFRSALLELGDQLLNLEDPADMGYAAAAIAGRTLGVTRAGYGTIDAARGIVDVARDWSLPGYPSLAGHRRFLDDGAYHDQLARGEPIIYADTRRDAPPSSAPAWLALGARSVINLPVFEQGALVAVIYLHHSEPRPWSPDEVAFLRNLADRTRSAVERRRAERSLRALNETLEKQVADRTADRNRLWRLSAELMLVCQFDGHILAVNPAWTATLGWTEAELIGRPTTDLIHPDDQLATDTSLRRLRAATAVNGLANRLRHKDGSYRWISWNAVPGGGVINAVGRDFTVEHDRTVALAASEARLRSIFDTSFQFMGLLAPDGTLLDANPASMAAIGVRLEDVAGLKFWQTPWFADTPGLPERIAAEIPRVAGGQRFRQEIRICLPGGPRSFDVSMRPAYDEQGEVVAIVPEAMDITERRTAEEQLRQAQKMEAVGQLTGGLAHDFNNLLQAISGSLELLTRRVEQGRQAEALRFGETARKSVARAAALTHRLLAFARRQALAPKTVNPNELVAGLTELIGRTVGPAITLEVEAAGEVWPVLCDSNQLENALLNLAINARDAMPGHGRLTIRTAPARLSAADMVNDEGAGPGDYMEFAVTDTGTGMDETTRARAFEPFFTTKPLGEGSGLGLSQIYGFVRQSNGFVRLNSTPGQGTSVHLFLPRHCAAPPGPEAERVVAEPAQAGRGKTVMLVEDEAEVRSLVSEHLRDLGYTVVEATDGPTALLMLHGEGSRADVLVTDIGLPGGTNGRQLADAARAFMPSLPVLFVTGYAGQALEAELSAGMGVLAKPFTFAELATRVREALS